MPISRTELCRRLNEAGFMAEDANETADRLLRLRGGAPEGLRDFPHDFRDIVRFIAHRDARADAAVHDTMVRNPLLFFIDIPVTRPAAYLGFQQAVAAIKSVETLTPATEEKTKKPRKEKSRAPAPPKP